MLNFNKILTSKILSLSIAVVFLLNSTVYGIDLPSKSHLRAPMMSGSMQGKGRMREAAGGVSGEHTTSRLPGFTAGASTDEKVAAANWALARTAVPDDLVLPGVYLSDNPDSYLTKRDIDSLKSAARDKVGKKMEGEVELELKGEQRKFEIKIIMKDWKIFRFLLPVGWGKAKGLEGNEIYSALTKIFGDMTPDEIGKLDSSAPYIVLSAGHIVDSSYHDHLAGDCVRNGVIFLHDSLPSIMEKVGFLNKNFKNALLQELLHHEFDHEITGRGHEAEADFLVRGVFRLSDILGSSMKRFIRRMDDARIINQTERSIFNIVSEIKQADREGSVSLESRLGKVIAMEVGITINDLEENFADEEDMINGLIKLLSYMDAILKIYKDKGSEEIYRVLSSIKRFLSVSRIKRPEKDQIDSALMSIASETGLEDYRMVGREYLRKVLDDVTDIEVQELIDNYEIWRKSGYKNDHDKDRYYLLVGSILGRSNELSIDIQGRIRKPFANLVYMVNVTSDGKTRSSVGRNNMLDYISDFTDKKYLEIMIRSACDPETRSQLSKDGLSDVEGEIRFIHGIAPDLFTSDLIRMVLEKTKPDASNDGRYARDTINVLIDLGVLQMAAAFSQKLQEIISQEAENSRSGSGTDKIARGFISDIRKLGLEGPSDKAKYTALMQKVLRFFYKVDRDMSAIAHFSLASKNNSLTAEKRGGGKLITEKFMIKDTLYEIPSLDPGNLPKDTMPELAKIILGQTGQNITFTIHGPPEHKKVADYLKTNPTILTDAISRSHGLHKGKLSEDIHIILATKYDFLAGDHQKNHTIILNASDIEVMMDDSGIQKADKTLYINELLSSALSEELAHERGAKGDNATEGRLAKGCAGNTAARLDIDQLQKYIYFLELSGEDIEEGYISHLEAIFEQAKAIIDHMKSIDEKTLLTAELAEWGVLDIAQAMIMSLRIRDEKEKDLFESVIRRLYDDEKILKQARFIYCVDYRETVANLRAIFPLMRRAFPPKPKRSEKEFIPSVRRVMNELENLLMLKVSAIKNTEKDFIDKLLMAIREHIEPADFKKMKEQLKSNFEDIKAALIEAEKKSSSLSSTFHSEREAGSLVILESEGWSRELESSGFFSQLVNILDSLDEVRAADHSDIVGPLASLVHTIVFSQDGRQRSQEGMDNILEYIQDDTDRHYLELLLDSACSSERRLQLNGDGLNIEEEIKNIANDAPDLFDRDLIDMVLERTKSKTEEDAKSATAAMEQLIDLEIETVTETFRLRLTEIQRDPGPSRDGANFFLEELHDLRDIPEENFAGKWNGLMKDILQFFKSVELMSERENIQPLAAPGPTKGALAQSDELQRLLITELNKQGEIMLHPHYDTSNPIRKRWVLSADLNQEGESPYQILRYVTVESYKSKAGVSAILGAPKTVFLRVGNLFVITPAAYDALEGVLRQDVSKQGKEDTDAQQLLDYLKGAVIKLDNIDTQAILFEEYTVPFLDAMLHNDFSGKNVIDAGAGSGFLSVLALRLGARAVFLIENDEAALNEAARVMALNGFVEGRDAEGRRYYLCAADLNNPDQIQSLLPSDFTSSEIIVLSHIGNPSTKRPYWYRYSANNVTSMALLGLIPQASLFIAGGIREESVLAKEMDHLMRTYPFDNLSAEVIKTNRSSDRFTAFRYAWWAKKATPLPSPAAALASEISIPTRLGSGTRDSL